MMVAPFATAVKEACRRVDYRWCRRPASHRQRAGTLRLGQRLVRRSPNQTTHGNGTAAAAGTRRRFVRDAVAGCQCVGLQLLQRKRLIDLLQLQHVFAAAALVQVVYVLCRGSVSRAWTQMLMSARATWPAFGGTVDMWANRSMYQRQTNPGSAAETLLAEELHRVELGP